MRVILTGMTHDPKVPSLTLGWRLKMSLGAHKAEWMASQLGVSRQTISRWCADRGAPPHRAYLLQWAALTETDPGWLVAPVEQPDEPDEAGHRCPASIAS